MKQAILSIALVLQSVPAFAQPLNYGVIDETSSGCEFWIEDAKISGFYRRGAAYGDFVSRIRVARDQSLINAGMLVRFENKDGEMESFYVVNDEEDAETGLISLSFLTRRKMFDDKPVVDNSIIELSWFIDVFRGGADSGVYRLWISRDGKNFDYPSLMGKATRDEPAFGGYGSASWIEQGAGLFDVKKSCQNP